MLQKCLPQILPTDLPKNLQMVLPKFCRKYRNGFAKISSKNDGTVTAGASSTIAACPWAFHRLRAHGIDFIKLHFGRKLFAHILIRKFCSDFTKTQHLQSFLSIIDNNLVFWGNLMP
jgi:hypothetical protein